MKYNQIIAIDPDCEKSGVAILNVDTKEIELKTLSFPELIYVIKMLNINSKINNLSSIVFVEAGWLNLSNWHIKSTDSKSVCAFKGNSVGRNHETGRKIIEMLEHHDIEVHEVKPLTKIWGSDRKSKISHKEISKFIPNFPKSSNQETRDSALIAWFKAGFLCKL